MVSFKCSPQDVGLNTDYSDYVDGSGNVNFATSCDFSQPPFNATTVLSASASFLEVSFSLVNSNPNPPNSDTIWKLEYGVDTEIKPSSSTGYPVIVLVRGWIKFVSDPEYTHALTGANILNPASKIRVNIMAICE